MTWKVWTEKSGDGRWRCRWKGEHGTGQQTFLYKQDARELSVSKRREFQRLRAGLPTVHSKEDFQGFRKAYTNWIRSRRAPGTGRIALLALSNWIEFAGLKFPVPGKTVNDFCDWLLNRDANLMVMGVPTERKRPLSPNYARILLRHLKAEFRWAKKHGFLTSDPFEHFEFPAPVQVARVLKPEEILSLLRELPETPRRALYFTLHTGLRISEVLRLDWKDVERGEKWYLTVVKSKTRFGKPAQTKTQRIHPNAIKVMGEPGTGPVFPVKAAWLQRALRRATISLGLGRVRWHDLRHTWATSFMDEVRDLRALMDAGGWNTEHAAMIYQHRTKRRTDATAEVQSLVPPEEAI